MHAELLNLIGPDARQGDFSDETEIKIDLRGGERSHGHIGMIFGLMLQSAALRDRKSRREAMGSARQSCKVSCGVLNCLRFMEYPAVEGKDLVGPDTECFGMASTDVDGFGLREETRQLLRRAALAEKSILDRPFINLGYIDFERYSGAGEQMATGFAPGCEDQSIT
jgi:hypothetical protein